MLFYGDGVDVVVVGGEHHGLCRGERHRVSSAITATLALATRRRVRQRPDLHHAVGPARGECRAIGGGGHVPDDTLVLAHAGERV